MALIISASDGKPLMADPVIQHMVHVPENSVLVLIDVQKAWDNPRWGRRNSPGAEKVMGKLLERFRENGRHVIHVHHDSNSESSLLRHGSPGFEFKAEVVPIDGEAVITKHVHSAFIGTDLEDRLREMGDPSVFFAGITTDHCVSTSSRMSGDMGFDTYIVEDACVAFDRKDLDGNVVPAEEVHRANLASINGEFATVLGSGDLSF